MEMAGVFFAGDKQLGSLLLTRWCMVEQSLRSMIIKHHSIQRNRLEQIEPNHTKDARGSGVGV
jgi:hypothetical protein